MGLDQGFNNEEDDGLETGEPSIPPRPLSQRLPQTERVYNRRVADNASYNQACSHLGCASPEEILIAFEVLEEWLSRIDDKDLSEGEKSYRLRDDGDYGEGTGLFPATQTNDAATGSWSDTYDDFLPARFTRQRITSTLPPDGESPFGISSRRAAPRLRRAKPVKLWGLRQDSRKRFSGLYLSKRRTPIQVDKLVGIIEQRLLSILETKCSHLRHHLNKFLKNLYKTFPRSLVDHVLRTILFRNNLPFELFYNQRD